MVSTPQGDHRKARSASTFSQAICSCGSADRRSTPVRNFQRPHPIDDPDLPIIPLGVGKDVVVSQIVAVAMGVPGVYAVDVDAPADDLVIDANQFPEQGLVTINMEAPSNE